MADWERLTPDEGPGGHKALSYRYQKERVFPHWLHLENSSVYPLSDAELLALARKCDECQRLHLIAREVLALMRLRMVQDAGLGRDQAMERVCDELESILVSFEDSDA